MLIGGDLKLGMHNEVDQSAHRFGLVGAISGEGRGILAWLIFGVSDMWVREIIPIALAPEDQRQARPSCSNP